MDEVKSSLLADDSTCCLDGSDDSFNNLFATLNEFAICSGCKINLCKSEVIKGSNSFPFSEQGLIWKQNQFKTLGINFSLSTRSSCMFDLNYKVKLKQIEGILNCYRARNLSLIGRICVIKSLLLPQLLYLFSVLCIKIPKIFFSNSLIRCSINLFGPVEMIGSKGFMSVIIIITVVFLWLTLTIFV